MEHTFLSATVLLILILDPLGNIPFFIAGLQQVAPERRTRVALRECAIAFATLLFFLLFGRGFMQLLHLTDESMQVAGGVILLLIAIRMVFPHEGPAADDGRAPGEPFIVPIAIPMIAGPSAMATVMLIVTGNPQKLVAWIGALVVGILVTLVVFLLSTRLKALLGEQVIHALERLMGLVLCALAVEMLLGGLVSYLRHLKVA